jgi:hypothetical protein
MYIYLYMCVCIIRIDTYICTYICTYIYLYMYVCIIRIDTYICTYNIYIYIYMYIYIYIYNVFTPGTATLDRDHRLLPLASTHSLCLMPYALY